MEINKFKSNYLYVLSGLCITLYILYVRVIMIRLPKDLNLFSEGKIDITLFFMVISGILISTLIIIINIAVLRKKSINQRFFTIYVHKFSEFLDRSLFEAYKAGNFFIQDGYDKISKIAKQFYLKFGNKQEGLLVFVNFFIRLFVVIAFLIDIFCFFMFDYFYKLLILLCIPLVNNLIIYILTDFSKNLGEISSCLIIKNIGTDVNTNLPITRYSASPGNEHIDLDYYIEQYIICSKISGYLQRYNVILNYYNAYFNIIIYSLYLGGWLYILVQ